MSGRYVVLRHDGIAEPHYDLMIETDEASPLMTWRVARWPIIGTVDLIRLSDHRRFYLDYEGPIDGNRGTVRRVEAGTYERVPSNDREWHLLLKPPAGVCGLTLLQDSAGQWQAERTE